jgi:hypothetical protein
VQLLISAYRLSVLGIIMHRGASVPPGSIDITQWSKGCRHESCLLG